MMMSFGHPMRTMMEMKQSEQQSDRVCVRVCVCVGRNCSQKKKKEGKACLFRVGRNMFDAYIAN